MTEMNEMDVQILKIAKDLAFEQYNQEFIQLPILKQRKLLDISAEIYQST